jgi:hypothetical protein
MMGARSRDKEATRTLRDLRVLLCVFSFGHSCRACRDSQRSFIKNIIRTDYCHLHLFCFISLTGESNRGSPMNSNAVKRNCKQKLEARGTSSKLDDTTRLEGLNPTIPSKIEVRYSDPRLKQQVQSLLEECTKWLNLDGSTKLLPSRIVDTDTVEVWLPR